MYHQKKMETILNELSKRFSTCLTVVTLLAELMRDYGLNVYTERDVLSRIRGGHTAATLRAFAGDRYCIGSHIDLLVALDDEAIEKNVRHLNENSIVFYD